MHQGDLAARVLHLSPERPGNKRDKEMNLRSAMYAKGHTSLSKELREPDKKEVLCFVIYTLFISEPKEYLIRNLRC